MNHRFVDSRGATQFPHGRAIFSNAPILQRYQKTLHSPCLLETNQSPENNHYYCFMATAITKGKSDNQSTALQIESQLDFHKPAAQEEQNFSENTEFVSSPLSSSPSDGDETPKNLPISQNSIASKDTNRTMLDVSRDPLRSIAMFSEFGAAIRPEMRANKSRASK